MGRLIISRKPGELTFIGGNIKIEVLEVNRGRVKFGITAPDEITVMREELIRQLETAYLDANGQDALGEGMRS